MTVTQTIEKVREVFITPNTVAALDMQSQVPTGFRVASPEEIALRYKTDPKFKKLMDDPSCWVWSNGVGLWSFGCHRIEADGRFTEITESEFENLDSKDRSWHNRLGNSPVALSSVPSDFIGGGYLYVIGDWLYDFTARVAYVALESPAELKELAGVAEKSLEKLKQTTTMPDVLKPIEHLIRAISETKE